MPEFTHAEKLEVIEHFIEQWRPARSSSIAGERDTYLILKSIADDLRGAQPGLISDTAQRLDRAISHAREKKTKQGYLMGNLRAVAEVVIGRWPSIKIALEHYERTGGRE